MKKLDDFFLPFLDQLGGRKSMRNRELYQSRLSLFLEKFGALPVTDVNGGHVAEWHELLLARGYKPATMAGYRQSIKSFLNYLVEDGAISLSPARKLKVGTTMSLRRKLPATDHLDAATSVAIEWMQMGSPTQVRDGLIFVLCTRCGPRSKEIRRLKLSEVVRALKRGPNSGGVFEASTDGKTEESLLRFDALVAEGFARYIDEVRPKTATIDICFIPPTKTRTKKDRELRWRMLTRSSLDNGFVRLCKETGVPTIRPHTIRHVVGNRVTREEDPKTAARILNHKDWQTAATAIRYYVHVEDEDINGAITSLSGYGNSIEIASMSDLFGFR